jgi:hypothetical protein
MKLTLRRQRHLHKTIVCSVMGQESRSPSRSSLRTRAEGHTVHVYICGAGWYKYMQTN